MIHIPGNLWNNNYVSYSFYFFDGSQIIPYGKGKLYNLCIICISRNPNKNIINACAC